jgi:hypothetical protein
MKKITTVKTVTLGGICAELEKKKWPDKLGKAIGLELYSAVGSGIGMIKY